MKNILILGSTGYLGCYLSQILSKNNKIFAHQNIRKVIRKKNIIPCKIDLNRLDKINSFLIRNNIEVIINLIACTNIEKCEKFKKKAKFLNETIVGNIINILTTNKLNIHFVQLSTDHLFDGKLASSYSENSKTKALNYYAETKLNAEKTSSIYKKTLIIRTNFFGKSYVKKNSFSDSIINKLSRFQKIDLWGNIYISPLHIKNLCEILYLLIKDRKIGIFNLSSEKISKYELGIRIAKKLKLNFNLIKKNKYDKSKFVIRPKNMSLKNKKILKCYPKLKSKLKLTYQINCLSDLKVLR